MKTTADNQRNRHSNVIALSLIGLLVTAPALLQAQDAGQDKRVIHQRILHKFDHDGDGKLNPRESYHARKFYQRWEQGHNADIDRPDVRRVPARPDRPRAEVRRPARSR